MELSGDFCNWAAVRLGRVRGKDEMDPVCVSLGEKPGNRVKWCHQSETVSYQIHPSKN